MRTRVVHCRRERYDVYVGRPSPWGNPFVIGSDGTREEVIAKYAAWVRTQPHLLARIAELLGKTLEGCGRPLPCNANVLANLADGLGWSSSFPVLSCPYIVVILAILTLWCYSGTGGHGFRPPAH